ncbi:MAG: hypothetical protein IKK34_06870 [Clostridia bacterium]|nr:hypothetical protein [Clostridia bacterium]
MKRLLALLLLLFFPVFARADLTITVINDQAGARAVVNANGREHTVWAGDAETITYGKSIVTIGAMNERADALVLFAPITPTLTIPHYVRFFIYCCDNAPDSSSKTRPYPRRASTELNGTITISSDGDRFTVTADRYYVGNMNTDKFHYHTCPSVDRMKDSNKTSLFDRDQATRNGYVPCKNCNP